MNTYFHIFSLQIVHLCKVSIDLIDNGGNIDLSEYDESSDGDDNADILLADSDPEPEMDNEPEETSCYGETQFPLSNSSNILLSKNGSVLWSMVPIPQVGRTPNSKHVQTTQIPQTPKKC